MIEWYERADCIKLQIEFDYISKQEETIFIQYRPSFYRVESNAWYPPIIKGLEQYECQRKYLYDSWTYWDHLMRTYLTGFLFLALIGMFSTFVTGKYGGV